MKGGSNPAIPTIIRKPPRKRGLLRFSPFRFLHECCRSKGLPVLGINLTSFKKVRILDLEENPYIHGVVGGTLGYWRSRDTLNHVRSVCLDWL